jgi:hypothetical protein
MALILRSGGLLVREGLLAAANACCCGEAECCAVSCMITFSVGGQDHVWDLSYDPNLADEVEYIHYQDDLVYGCYNHRVFVGGCAVCKNGKLIIGVGVVVSSTGASGDCYYWSPDKYAPGEGGAVDVFYAKAKLRKIEVNSCSPCENNTDLGVHEFEVLSDASAAITACVAMGDSIFQAECGIVCEENYEISPDECPGNLIQTEASLPEGCDPSDFEITNVSVECCEFP